MIIRHHKVLFTTLLLTTFIISILIVSNLALDKQVSISEQTYYNNQLTELLDTITFDNNILKSKQTISTANYLQYLGNLTPKSYYIAKQNNKPIAVIFNTTAPDGYNGDINLLVAIKLDSSNTQASIINIKVLQHQETPGLGDKIEPARSNWLTQFHNKQLRQQQPVWQAKHDIDSITGATITSQAVTKAIYNCLLLVNNHPELLENTQ